MSQQAAQYQRDRELAEQLQAIENEQNVNYRQPDPVTSPSSASSVWNLFPSMISMPFSSEPAAAPGQRTAYNPSDVGSKPPARGAAYGTPGSTATSPNSPNSPPGLLVSTQETVRRMSQSFRMDRTGTISPPSRRNSAPGGNVSAYTNDFTLARALQAMEFEIADETLSRRRSSLIEARRRSTMSVEGYDFTAEPDTDDRYTFHIYFVIIMNIIIIPLYYYLFT